VSSFVVIATPSFAKEADVLLEEKGVSKVSKIIKEVDEKEPLQFLISGKEKTIQSGSTEKDLLKNFYEMQQKIASIKQGNDVHVLDQFVFGSDNNIKFLNQLAIFYNIDDSSLTLADVGNSMARFVNEHSWIFDGYSYEKTSVDQKTIISHLLGHFGQMDSEVLAICPLAKDIWSRAWTLGLNLYQETNDPTYVRVVVDQAIEGALTSGTCIQGRIDRGFVAYVNLLGFAGVGAFFKL
jgi:hypothetical protein